jgi:hypothetical protein
MCGIHCEFHPVLESSRDYRRVAVDGGSLDLFVPPFDPSLLLSLSLPSPRTEANVSLFAIPTDATVKGIVNCDSAVGAGGVFHAVRYYVSWCVLCASTSSSLGKWSRAARTSELRDYIRWLMYHREDVVARSVTDRGRE